MLDCPLRKGDMSALQRDLASEKGLAGRGFRHGLDECIIKNPGHSGRISDRMMATAVEAIIGAVYKDSGLDFGAVRAVMDKLGFFDHPLLKVSAGTSRIWFTDNVKRHTRKLGELEIGAVDGDQFCRQRQ